MLFLIWWLIILGWLTLVLRVVASYRNSLVISCRTFFWFLLWSLWFIISILLQIVHWIISRRCLHLLITVLVRDGVCFWDFSILNFYQILFQYLNKERDTISDVICYSCLCKSKSLSEVEESWGTLIGLMDWNES